jgi:molybdate transport system ATP-binding protein
VIPVTLDVSLTQGTFRCEVHERFDARAIALVGPSGAGKTTLLEIIAGLRRPATGRIAIADHVLLDTTAGIDVAPRHRRIGYVPQDLALFPHLDVRRNILFGAARGKGAETSSAARNAVATASGGGAATHDAAPLAHDRVIDLLELRPLLDRPIAGLSGGERQRVALARALMSGPDLLLLDEPLAALHAALRDRILEDLRHVRDDLRMPLMYVSHDPDEVRAIADWVIVLDGGRSIRAGTPRDAL